jgi:hypothetical protein
MSSGAKEENGLRWREFNNGGETGDERTGRVKRSGRELGSHSNQFSYRMFAADHPSGIIAAKLTMVKAGYAMPRCPRPVPVYEHGWERNWTQNGIYPNQRSLNKVHV